MQNSWPSPPAKLDSSSPRKGTLKRAAATIRRIKRSSVSLIEASDLGGKSTLLNLVKASAEAFMAADVNNDDKLDFDEFVRVIPPETLRAHSDETAREVFEMADYDGNGSISREEFFFFTFSWVTQHAGVASSLEKCFNRFDTTGDGELNLREFTQAVEIFGFGELGHDIFEELDANHSGAVSYVELFAAVKARKGHYSIDTQRLLTAMSFDLVKSAEGRNHSADLVFRADPWQCSTAKELRSEIALRMNEELGRPKDVWQAMAKCTYARRRLNREQFCNAVRRTFGYNGIEAVLWMGYDEVRAPSLRRLVPHRTLLLRVACPPRLDLCCAVDGRRQER